MTCESRGRYSHVIIPWSLLEYCFSMDQSLNSIRECGWMFWTGQISELYEFHTADSSRPMELLDWRNDGQSAFVVLVPTRVVINKCDNRVTNGTFTIRYVNDFGLSQSWRKSRNCDATDTCPVSVKWSVIGRYSVAYRLRSHGSETWPGPGSSWPSKSAAAVMLRSLADCVL